MAVIDHCEYASRNGLLSADQQRHLKDLIDLKHDPKPALECYLVLKVLSDSDHELLKGRGWSSYIVRSGSLNPVYPNAEEAALEKAVQSVLADRIDEIRLGAMPEVATVRSSTQSRGITIVRGDGFLVSLDSE